MACTSQSAVDYIQQARVHLVRELRSLSVIIENLYQQEVLSDEEVSKIQAETDDYDKTRKILDSVIKKGEQACYVLLRIIDMTRKRTLGRSSLFPEKKSEASTGTKKFDLHHWISCFSFKEDTHMDVNYLQGPRPCHRYQRKLKSKAQKISNKFWMANKNLFEERNRPDLSYTPLVLEEQGNVSPSKIKKLKSKKSKMSRPKKLRTYIPEDKPEISPSDLLKTDKDYVLVGKPGIGKTALTHEMLKLWAERDGEELDYMFYFDMRETSDLMKATSLEDLLFSVFSEPDEGKEEVLDDIKKNSDNVTIIFDGITDLSSSVVKRLVDKDLLPDAKIIITCRPDDEEDFFSRDFRRVEVKGFSEWSIKTYLSVTLGEEQKKVLNNLELLTLCHVPMYALMVSVCFSSEISPQPCTTTEIYINIVRLCLKMNSNKKKTKCLNFYINNKREQILSLAEAAFNAAERKTVILTDLSCEDSCVLSFLKPLFIKVAHTETITAYSFLHYTMQEFFAALWLLKNPDKVQDVFQQSLTEEMKHMRHLIPFMCRLLNEKNPSLMTCLIPAEELRSTSDGFFKELINKDRGSDVDILFLCQCLYESQCPEACSDLLNTLDYSLDLSEQSLDPYSCCAVAYVVSQSKERKIHLDLENVVISEQGMRRLIGCLQRVQWCDPLPRQLWKIFLLSEEQMDHSSLLGVDGNQLHLPVEGKKQLFEGAVKVMQKVTTKVNVCLYWDRPTPVCQHLCESLFEGLLHISSLSFRVTHRDPGSEDQERHHETLRREKKRLLLELCLKAALHKEESFHSVVKRLFSLFSVNTDLINILLDFYQHVKSEGCSSVIPKLRSVFQSAPSVWIIDLSERKTSILLEVLKLQPEKKQVELTGWSDEESEVRSLLQCLPYISQLSFSPWFKVLNQTRFFGNLFCAAAEREQQTGEKILELLSSVCTYQTFPLNDRDMDDDDDYDPEYQCDFLLDLCSHVKDYETKTGLRVLPSLQSVFQSAPSVWFIDPSKRKTSILLEVLKLQPEKKQVELTGCSDEESEVRSLLQCLPYISQLSFSPWFKVLNQTRFFGNLFCAAAEREQQTGEKILEMLSSVCTYQTFPLNDSYFDDDDDDLKYQCDFLLDLFSHVKDDETKTGLRVLPVFQSVFQSAPSVWIIDLSKRKTSILLEVLKLQPEKKQVELTGCSDEESEVRSLLQCLPYISQLSFVSQSSDPSDEARFFGNLFCAAAEREQQTGEKILELLSSVCTYQTFPLNDRDMDDDDDYDPEYQCDFLLDLCSHVKDYETKTGLRVLPSLQSVFQSAPSVWFIDPSKRKTSILLEVLKLQPEKKQVELTGCSDEESEVRSLLQCLPYISQLSFSPWFKVLNQTRFFGNLFCAAAEREQQTGEKILEMLSSVCTYQTFPLNDRDMDDDDPEYQCDFLLDVFSHVKDYETKTGLRVLPSLQSVFQSAPPVWFIDPSKRKTSILLEVLKLQPEKKRVELTGCSDEESEVRSLLQCLPYISQLSFVSQSSDPSDEARFFGNLFCAAAEREQQTGEKILELLSSVCTYQTFHLNDRDMDDDDDYDPEYQCDFLLDLFSHVKDYETKTGLRVLPSLQSVFQSVFQSAPPVWFIDLSERKTSILLEVLKLQPEKKRVELTGWSDEESEVRSLLQCLPYISQLRLSSHMVLQLFHWVRRGRLFCPLAVDELSLAPDRAQLSDRELLKVVSGLASLLRYCAVRRLDLTESCFPAQCLITLLLHPGSLTIRLSEESFQQLLTLLHEIQDQDLTLFFLSKVGGDLNCCCVNWELLHYLLQQPSAQTITVNLRKNHFLQENVTRLLPFLDRILLKRSSPSFVLAAIREIYKAQTSQIIPSLQRSLGHVINLTCRELDSEDCAALLFTLRHSDRVKLNLTWTSIPTEETQSILCSLDRVSQLSVDRNLLLRFIHCCAASDVLQEAASDLFRTLQHRLDLSCSSCVELEDQTQTLCLTGDDCRAVLRHSTQLSQLDLRDCEVEDSGLDLLFPVLHRVHLRASKAVLLQLLSLVPVNPEGDSVRRAESLCAALGGELDLSHTTLDQRACGALALMLDFSEGLEELNLSHCQLTDQLLLTLITHLHKVHVLDLSHNKITDVSTDKLLQLVCINPSTVTVRLFGNNIVDRTTFKKHTQFEIW
ncbi:uncharacterized protein LOC108879369 isoform X50 [Lates calcarifer]|uniref:Uncharacterized protein LOC108879369 isoform X50 n=1 Tax=Lates calcarifer TaxID=8187 RepID=A0AAJ8B4F7_LATCA|nr:uncharacterized protein LOC108879369 isoform X50 [Lates calcarifer]